MQLFKAALAILWDSLFSINQPPARYLGRALLIDLPFSLPMAVLIGLAFPGKAPDFSKQSPLMLIFGLCILSPLMETLMMMLIFGLLGLFTKRLAYLAIGSALIWAGLHSLAAWAWGLGVLWPFLIFSICYLNWEPRSRGHAFLMTAGLHALHNLPPALILMADLLVRH